jgi:hypothetical protein
VHHRVGLRNRSAAAHRSVTLEAKREERSVYSIGAIPHAPCPSPNHHAAAPPGGVGGVDACAFDPLDAAAAIATFADAPERGPISELTSRAWDALHRTHDAMCMPLPPDSNGPPDDGTMDPASPISTATTQDAFVARIEHLATQTQAVQNLGLIATDPSRCLDARRLALRMLANITVTCRLVVASAHLRGPLVDAVVGYALAPPPAPTPAAGGAPSAAFPQPTLGIAGAPYVAPNAPLLPTSVLGVVVQRALPVLVKHQGFEAFMSSLGNTADWRDAVLLCVSVASNVEGGLNDSGPLRVVLPYLVAALENFTAGSGAADAHASLANALASSGTVASARAWDLSAMGNALAPDWVVEVLRCLNAVADTRHGHWLLEEVLVPRDAAVITRMAWSLISSPDQLVSKLALLLFARYESHAACVCTTYPGIEACSAYASQRPSIREAALRFLCCVPRLVGARTAVDGPLFTAVRGILCGNERHARVAALSLLVALISAGFGEMVKVVAHSVADALVSIAYPDTPIDDGFCVTTTTGSYDGDDPDGENQQQQHAEPPSMVGGLDHDELTLVECLMQIIDVDPFAETSPLGEPRGAGSGGNSGLCAFSED